MKFGLSQINEVRLNEDEEADLYEIYKSHPYILMARNSFLGGVLNSPPEVEIAGFGIKQSALIAGVMRKYYLPFIHAMYDWIKMFGIYPWYAKTDSETGFRYPEIPPYGSGYIKTYLTKSGNQKFHYYGNTDTKPVRKMKFGWKYREKVPDVWGNFRSDLRSVLDDYRTARVVRQSTEIVSYQEARPQHMFEYKPPRNNAGDDNLTTLETFGGAIAGAVQKQQEDLLHKKISVRTDHLQQGIMQSIAQNRGATMRFGTGPIMRTEYASEKWERENAGLLSRAIPLQPDYVYKSAQMPKASIDYSKLIQRIDTMLSALMDFPKQMIEAPSGNRASNAEGLKQNMKDRNDDWISFMCGQVKSIFIELHRDILEVGMDVVMESRVKKGVFVDISLEDEIEVTMPAKSNLEIRDYMELVDKGYMAKETAAKHIFASYGLLEEDIQITYPEEQPLKKKPKKF